MVSAADNNTNASGSRLRPWRATAPVSTGCRPVGFGGDARAIALCRRGRQRLAWLTRRIGLVAIGYRSASRSLACRVATIPARSCRDRTGRRRAQRTNRLAGRFEGKEGPLRRADASAAFTLSGYAHSQDDALKAAASSFGRVVTTRDTETAVRAGSSRYCNL